MRFFLVLAAFGAVAYAQGQAEPGCRPGTYSCQGSNIYTCNGSGKQVLSAKCNKNCCKASGGVAHCVC